MDDTPVTPGVTPGSQTAVLASQDVRSRFIALVQQGLSIGDAATAIGITRQSVHRYLKQHPEFRVAVEAAKGRQQISRRLAALPPPVPDEPPPYPPPPSPPPVWAVDGVPVPPAPCRIDPAAAYDLLWRLANNADNSAHPIVQKAALEWVARGTVGVEIVRDTLQVELDADRQRERARIQDAEPTGKPTSSGPPPLVVCLPRNGSEAPGRGPKPATGPVDAEVVDT